MNTLVENILHLDNQSTCEDYRFDSHARIRYHNLSQIGDKEYDTPCKWIISRSHDKGGYIIRQYDLSDANFDKLVYQDHMLVKDINETNKGAKNVFLESTIDGARCLILLVVNDHIEKLQTVDRLNDDAIVYLSAIDTICFLGIEEKKAILQVGYQIMISSGHVLSPADDESIDELLSGCFYMRFLGEILWNDAIFYNPYEAFNLISKQDTNVRHAIKLVLLNVAMKDRRVSRLHALREFSLSSNLPL